MRATWFAALSAGLAACTFPTVDYVDGGAEGGPSCAAPIKCANTAMSCATTAGNKLTMCTKACHADTVCVATCDATQKSELTACSAACDSCAASTCLGAATNCRALVGP